MNTWNTAQLIEVFAPDSLRPHILEVCAKKGKYKGFLQNSAPQHSREAAAVWYGIVSLIAPYRNIPVGAVLMMSEKERKLFDLASRWAEVLFTILTCVEPFSRWSAEECRFAPGTREQVQQTLTLAQAKKEADNA